MNREWRDKWIKALRSGAYIQGYRKLRTNDTYCCLGVLCDLVRPDLWHEYDRESFPGKVVYEHDAVIDKPNDYVLDKTGLETDNCEDLIELNDDEQAGFPAIADWIEKHL